MKKIKKFVVITRNTQRTWEVSVYDSDVTDPDLELSEMIYAQMDEHFGRKLEYISTIEDEKTPEDIMKEYLEFGVNIDKKLSYNGDVSTGTMSREKKNELIMYLNKNMF